MHAHMARFLPERETYSRIYLHAHTSRYIGIMYNTSHLLFVSRFQSLWLLSHTGCVRAVLRSFSLRKGVTMAWWGKSKSQRERELCYSSLFFDILTKEILSATFLRATWEFTGAPRDYERLIARKRQDSPTLSFLSTSWLQANTLLLTLSTRRAIVIV